MNVLGIVLFALALTASIVFHEAGHFVTARHYGMRASKFFVGFGPTLWSVKKGETEYGVKGIPIGGFVKIEGMTSLDEIDPADEKRAFRNASARARAVVMIAGSVAQFVLALFLIYLTLVAFGTWQASATTVGGTSCVSVTTTECAGRTVRHRRRRRASRRATKSSALTVWRSPTGPSSPSSCATTAPVLRPWSSSATASSSRCGPNLVAVQRDRATGGAGHRLGRRDRAVPGPGERGLRAAVGSPGDVRHRRFGLRRDVRPSSPRRSTTSVRSSATTVTPKASSAWWVRPASAVTWSPLEDTSASERVATFVLLVAGINIAVGVFNLLPLLPLDGGHLAVLGFEQGRHGAPPAVRLQRPGAPGRLRQAPPHDLRHGGDPARIQPAGALSRHRQPDQARVTRAVAFLCRAPRNPAPPPPDSQ